jgi:DNA topoisomerase-1
MRAVPAERRQRKPRVAGLVYVSDTAPGITRTRRGSGFVYLLPSGRALRQPGHLTRIRSLVIPPAWTDVWICPLPNGHLQATGRDARGRKQYRYHPKWTESQHQTKYSRMAAFGAALPALRRRVSADLARRGMPRVKVLALVAALLERTMIRVGNKEYRRQNGSYGLTTLLDRHAKVRSTTVRFRFRGKGGKAHDVTITDPRLARLVRNCQELPGRQLFQYSDADGQPQDIGSGDVNDYLRDTMGEAFTAKDFRTWFGTVMAMDALVEIGKPATPTAAERNIVCAVDAVSGLLGNTRAVCRRCYIHPVVFDVYLDGGLPRPPRVTVSRNGGLSPMETAALSLLRRELASSSKAA